MENLDISGNELSGGLDLLPSQSTYTVNAQSDQRKGIQAEVALLLVWYDDCWHKQLLVSYPVTARSVLFIKLYHCATGLLPVFRALLKPPAIGHLQVGYRQTCEAEGYIEVY
ncbi:hypothetical protein XU18_3296 [Perkinsela sp. CCAP 1560/4]|nr:hypothetical protein XU18_3296 [Perkinsela sp. CCAP 1560/4]|eukprot:KNH05714.1 hypothetical protein XU18_3296 [Perkinsela sp. CCAP 1560/4]